MKRIATHFEMENKREELQQSIVEGENICTYSVQYDDGRGVYVNDMFCGELSECEEFVRYEAKNCHESIVGIALISLDKNLCEDTTLEFFPVEG